MSCDHGIFECHDTQLSSVSHISITPVSYRCCHNGFQGCFSCTLLLWFLKSSTQVFTIDFHRSLVYWGRKMWHQYWCQLELLSKLVWTFQYIILVTPASHLNSDTFLSGFNGQLIEPFMLFHLFLVNLYC